MAAVAGGRRPQLRRVVPPRVGRGPTGEQPRDWRVLRPRLLESAGQLFGALGERRPLRAGPSPGREHHQLRPVARDLASLAPEALAGEPGRCQRCVGLSAGQLAQGQVQLQLRPVRGVDPLVAPAARPRRRRPRRGARRRAAPGSGPRRARPARSPQRAYAASASSYTPQRTRQVTAVEGQRAPGCARPAPPRGPDPRPRRSAAPRRARARHARRRRRRGGAATSRLSVRASQIRSPRAARTPRGRPQVRQRLAVPAQDHREHVAAAHQAARPDLPADGLGDGPIELTKPAAGLPIQREGAAEGRSNVGEPIRVAAAPRQLARRTGARARPRRSDPGRAARCPGHGARPTASTGRRTPKPARCARDARLGRLGDGQPQQLLGVRDLLAAGHPGPLPPPPRDH